MAVIFLHRQYSLQPFARHYRHADELVLDMFQIPQDEKSLLVVREDFAPQISQDVREYHQVRNRECVMRRILRFCLVQGCSEDAPFRAFLYRIGLSLPVTAHRTIVSPPWTGCSPVFGRCRV